MGIRACFVRDCESKSTHTYTDPPEYYILHVYMYMDIYIYIDAVHCKESAQMAKMESLGRQVRFRTWGFLGCRMSG